MAGLARKISLSDCFGKDEKDPGGTRRWGRMLVKKLESPFVWSEESREMLRKLGCTSHEPEACTQEGVHTLVPRDLFCCSRAKSSRTWRENWRKWWRCLMKLCSKGEMLLRSHRCRILRGQLHLFRGFSDVFLVKRDGCRSCHIHARGSCTACRYYARACAFSCHWSWQIFCRILQPRIRKVFHLCEFVCESSSFLILQKSFHNQETGREMAFRQCELAYG